MYKHIAIDNVTHDTLKRIARENGRSIVGQLRIMVDKYEEQKKAQDVFTSATPASVYEKPKTETDKRIAELQKKMNAIDDEIERNGGEEPPEYYEMFNEVVELQKKQMAERGLTTQL